MDRVVVPARVAAVLFTYRFISRLYFYLPVLVLYFVERGQSFLYIGILLCSYSLAVLIVEGRAVRWVDKLGVRNSIIAGELIKACGLALLVYAPDFVWLLLAQVLIGLGYCLAMSGDAVLVSRLFHQAEQHAQVQKTAHVLVLSGVIFACLAGGWVAQYHGVYLVLLISLPAPLLAALTAVYFVEPAVPARSAGQAGAYNRLPRSSQVRVTLLSYGVSRAIFMSMFVVFIPVAYLLQYKVPLAMFGLVIGGYTLVSVLVATNSSAICRVLGERTCQAVSYLGLVLAGAFLVFQGPFPMLLYLAPVLLGFAAGITRPLAVAQFARLLEPCARSRALTLAEAVNATVSVLLILGICQVMDMHGIERGLKMLSMLIVVLAGLTMACILGVGCTVGGRGKR